MLKGGRQARPKEGSDVDLILLVLMLALVGFVIHLITTHIPMAAPFRTAIYIIVLVAVVLYLLRRFGGVLPNVLG